MPLAENLLLSKQATDSRNNNNNETDSIFQNKSSSRQPNNASVLTAGGRSGNEATDQQFRISFTNFGFVQSLNSSRQSLEEKSALSTHVDPQLPMTANQIMIQGGDASRDALKPRIHTQMPQKKSHKRVAIMTNEIID